MVRGISFQTFRKKKHTILWHSVKDLKSGTWDLNENGDWNEKLSMEQHFSTFQLYQHKKVNVKFKNNQLKKD